MIDSLNFTAVDRLKIECEIRKFLRRVPYSILSVRRRFSFAPTSKLTGSRKRRGSVHVIELARPNLRRQEGGHSRARSQVGQRLRSGKAKKEIEADDSEEKIRDELENWL